MSRQVGESRRAIRKLGVLSAVLVLLVLAGSAGILAYASATVDRLQAQEERALVAATIRRLEDRLSRDVTTATVWDQAYETLRPGGDLEWMDAEIGSYYANNRGHDLTVVVDNQDRPFYAWIGLHRARAENAKPFLDYAQPLLRKVRAEERAAPATRPPLEPTDPGLAVRATGVILSQGVHYLATASTVTRETASAPRDAPAVVVISAQRLDRVLIPALREEHNIRGATITALDQPSEEAATLFGPDGTPVVKVAWRPQQPGLYALRDAAGWFALGLAVLFTCGALLVLHVRAIIRKLDAHEQGHRQAVAELVRARDEAEAANQAKSQFLANTSHEIRTPLNGILGMTQVMERSDLSAADRNRLQVIRDSGENLLAVLNDILDLSKIEAGRMELDLQDFDLGDTVRSACRPFANLAVQKEIGFRLEIDDEALGVWRGDPVRFRQVIANLLSNAVKFTAAGGVLVRVERAFPGVAVTVTDTGIGIPEQRLSSLFGKFVQADSSTTRRFGGTGLGLAISRDLVDLMGGALTVASAEGDGSTFKFTVAFEPVAAAPQIRAPDGVEGPAAARSVRILAAEDNPTNRLILTALLETFGAELTTVTNGREAVEAVRTGRFDVVLMDIQMPELDGLEATAAIRELERVEARPRTSILALTANAMSHQVARYAECGMDGFVAKPIEAEKLFAAIDQVMEAREAAGLAA